MAHAAIGELRRVRQHPIVVSGLAYAYGKAGKASSARQTIDLLESLHSQRRVPPYFMAMAWAGLAKPDEVARWLEQAYTERSGWLCYLPIEPAFDLIRSDRRFAELAARLPSDTHIFRAAGK